jgi:HAD superfamily hydrolase (TIGR01549 family)
VYTGAGDGQTGLSLPRAIFLDLGDTLAYQDPPGDLVLADLLASRGIATTPMSIHRARLAATSRYYALALSRSGLGLAEDKRALVDEFDHALLVSLGVADRGDLSAADVQAAFRGLSRRLRLFDDSLEALIELRRLGLRLAIVSNWDGLLIDRCRDLGLVDQLDTIVGSAAVGVEKPDPAIFDLARRRLGLAASEVWHVGDLYTIDVLGARSAGIQPILLDRYDLLARIDCPRIRTLRELPDLARRAGLVNDFGDGAVPMTR